MKFDIAPGTGRVQVTRVFEASRSRVFSWWATAEKYQQWSGCKEAVRCDVTMDFRVGGGFTQVMELAVQGGTCEFIVTGVYEEIVEPERIEYAADLGGAPVRVTVEFFEQGKNTEVVTTYEGCPDDFFAENVSRGTSESCDKLQALIAG